jgi:cell division initiation protein
MADSDTSEFQAARFTRSATDRIANREFPLAVRGYDRHAVDEFVQEVLQLVSELEGRQTRESVVQRALDEIGEETAGILQRAHETADEIAARSRAQAEGRIQRAEREADMLRQQADAYSEQLIVDTRILWEERQRLLQDIRQLADEVLATAEDASERVAQPALISEQEEPEAGAADEVVPDTELVPDNEVVADIEAVPDSAEEGPPTSEVELDVIPGGAEEDTDEGELPENR